MPIVSGITIATITALVPAQCLGLPPWKWIIIGFAGIGVISAIVFALKQSSDERDLGSKVDKLLAEKGISPGQPVTSSLPPAASAPQPITETKASPPDIDGELYRLAVAPRTMSWELVRELYKVSGRPSEAAVDCDVLVEMYLVNLSKQQKFIRDVRLSAEINGVRTNFERMPDFRSKDISNQKYEYAIESDGDFYTPEKQMRALMSQTPLALIPEQPIEGWIRFMAKEINPDQIDPKSWQVIVADSTGTEHPITKVSQKKLAGKIGLRRIIG